MSRCKKPVALCIHPLYVLEIDRIPGEMYISAGGHWYVWDPIPEGMSLEEYYLKKGILNLAEAIDREILEELLAIAQQK